MAKRVSSTSKTTRKATWNLQEFSPISIGEGVLYVKVTGPYTPEDRKLWLVLLQEAWESCSPQTCVPLSRIAHLAPEVDLEKGPRWIWDATKRLSETLVEWVVVEHDRMKVIGCSVLVDSAIVEQNESTGLITVIYSIPDALCRLFLTQARIDLARVQSLLAVQGPFHHARSEFSGPS